LFQATELLKNYIPGSMENSAKMEVLFCILEESMALGDRVLVFSQSLFTLNLIEDFLQRTSLPGRQEKWARNWNYYRKLSAVRILCVSLLNFKPFFFFSLKFKGFFPSSSSSSFPLENDYV
jgi:hypothetical protein